MKCQYLITIHPSTISSIVCNNSLSSDRVYALTVSHDLKMCTARVDQCPKKKQKCEINRRCWELGI